MSMYGDDYEYAGSRLDGTIVTLDNKPVYVNKIGPKMVAVLSWLNSLDDTFKHDAKELDLHPVKLGYCNAYGTASYLMRKPMRRDYKQGLRHGNFFSLGEVHAERIGYQLLDNVIKGVYPTYEQVVETATGKVPQLNPFKAVKVGRMAWCREWAMDTTGILLYKGKPVGNHVEGKNVLDDSHSYLREALEEAL